MSNDDQRITFPEKGDWQRLLDQRTLIERMIADESDRENYETPSGKLALLNAILKQTVFSPTDTYELQCMGVVLGDAFVQGLGLEWVIVEDSYGRDPALRMPGTSIIIYPLTMISKRLEREKAIDVIELFGVLAEEIEQMKADGY